jgi:hypothetical protein
MTLSKSGKDLRGTYSYKKNGVSIKISGSVDKSGALIINEYNENGILTGIFKGTLLEGNILGNWSKADGSSVMPFNLKESNISELENNQLQSSKINWEGNYTLTGDYINKELTISKPNSKGEFEFEFIVSSESCIAYSYLGTARLKNNTYATGTAEDNFGKCKITFNYNTSKKFIEVGIDGGVRCHPDGVYKIAY